MEAFGIVLIAVCLLAVVAAAISYRGTGSIYKGLGRAGALSMGGDENTAPGPGPGARSQAQASSAEALEEIRQMLEAKNERRVARGRAPLDVDAELARLTASQPGQVDAGLRDEVRQLVVARNERRLRQGKPPLDVDEEVERQLRELSG